MTADHEAQRQATDSQTTDQGALDVVAQHLGLSRAATASAFVALAEAGYTVVKTRYEYAGMYMHEGREDTRIRRIVGPWVPVPEGSADRGSEEGGAR